jgi:hypothetical protein
MMTREEILLEIEKIDARIEFLDADRTKWISVWAQDGPAYNHGPYLRRLEKKRIKARKARLLKNLRRIDAAAPPEN